LVILGKDRQRHTTPTAALARLPPLPRYNGGRITFFPGVRQTMPHRRVILLAFVAALHVGVTAALLASREWLQQLHFEMREAIVIALTFGQALVAGAWAALGPLRAVVRIPAAALWTLAISFVVAYQIGGTTELDRILMLSGAMLAQMLVMQLPLGLVCRWTRVRLALAGTSGRPPVGGEFQFGIRELFVLTTIVAAFLGFSRGVVGYFHLQASGGVDWRIVVNLSLLVCCNALLTLPLILALLLARRSALAFLVGLAFAGGVTLLEQSLFEALAQGPSNNAGLWWINGMECLWVFASLLLVRLAGYRLLRRGAAPSGAAAEPA
jgi:hypothetical protein